MRISRQVDSHVAADFATAGVRLGTMWDVYTRILVPFGKLLTDMEAAGMAVDRWVGGGGVHQRWWVGAKRWWMSAGRWSCGWLRAGGAGGCLHMAVQRWWGEKQKWRKGSWWQQGPSCLTCTRP